MRLVFLPVLLALPACTVPERSAPPTTTTNVPASKAGGFECDATAGQYAVGQKATPALGAELMKKTGSEKLRWLPPRSAATMDYNPLRLNVSYDDDMVIILVNCG